MSDEQGKKINWGGLIKGLAAGAAVVAGVLLVAPGLVPGLGLSGLLATEGIGMVITKIAGAAIATTGLSYLLSDESGSDNANRHAEQHREAKESFAIREDMRKMQAVMMARMAANGHQPAMAMANQPAR